MVALLLAAGFARAQSPTVQNSASLQSTVESIAAVHHGHVALFAQDLKTGRTVVIHPEEPVQTASVIKLTILYDNDNEGEVTIAKLAKAIATAWSAVGFGDFDMKYPSSNK